MDRFPSQHTLLLLKAFHNVLDSSIDRHNAFAAAGKMIRDILPSETAVVAAVGDSKGQYDVSYIDPAQMRPCLSYPSIQILFSQTADARTTVTSSVDTNSETSQWLSGHGYLQAVIAPVHAEACYGVLAVFCPQVHDDLSALRSILDATAGLTARFIAVQEQRVYLDARCRQLYDQLQEMQTLLMAKDEEASRLLSESERSRRALLDILEDQTMAEERERELLVQLNHAQKMEAVGRLAGGVAHDYNNMLSVIIGYAEIAMMKADRQDSIYSDLNEIFSAAQRSASITHQLLAFARKQPHRPATVKINEAITEQIKMVRRLIGEDIQLVWQPGEEIWPIYLDPSQLDQILANLSVNARDAISGPGVITIETRNVTLGLDEMPDSSDASPGDYICLSFTDTGCGMDAATLEHIFEPFFTTKGVGEGTGLGLATVYGIIKQNHGFIDVTSTPGAGTRFCLYFTRHTALPEASVASSPDPNIESHGETVLIVEDEQTILDLARSILENKGYQVICASSPLQALKIANQVEHKIDLLLTDVIMPEMDGHTLSERLRSHLPELRVLFMSGYPADVLASRGVMQDGVNYLQKPFAYRDLLTRVHQALASH